MKSDLGVWTYEDCALLLVTAAGGVFKGTTGLVLEATPPDHRVAITSNLLIARFIGVSIPVIGAGVALDRGASSADTVLGFALAVGLGVICAGALLGRALRRAQQTDLSQPNLREMETLREH
jgi:hypothetical protein